MRSLRAILLFAASMLLATGAWAQDTTARASFTPSSATVGDPVRFRIDVTGNAESNGPLPQIKVEGLEFSYLGNQKRYDVSFINGAVRRTTTVTHLFQVVAKQPGTFTVPALRIDAGGGTVATTEPVSLAIQPGGAGGGSGTVDRAGRAEIILP